MEEQPLIYSNKKGLNWVNLIVFGALTLIVIGIYAIVGIQVADKVSPPNTACDASKFPINYSPYVGDFSDQTILVANRTAIINVTFISKKLKSTFKNKK